MSTTDIVTMTQAELDELIQKRIRRVRDEYEESGQKSWKAESRKWENLAKQKQSRTSAQQFREVLEDRDAWRRRARFNVAKIQVLEELNDKLLRTIEGTKKANPEEPTNG